MALGQCFKCGERYFPGHQCKIKLQMLMGQTADETEMLVSVEDSSGDTTEPDAHEEAIVSMHATSSNPIHNTMRFKGLIGTTPIFALIDSGSTHSFVNPLVLQDKSHQLVATNPMIVMVANGERMVTDFKCESLLFSIQGHEFCHDLRLLPVKGYDVILGLDWLSKFGPMKVDWHHKWVEITENGATIRLQVVPDSATIQCCGGVELPSEWKPQSELLVAQIWLCEAQPTLDKHVLVELLELLQQFAYVFENQATLPPTRNIDHAIPLLPNAQPVNLRPYRYSHYQKLELKSIIDELLKASVIRPSCSPFASPALLVRKKDGT
jgi:Retroviral aspartyl protease